MIKSKGRKSIPLTPISIGRHLVYSEGIKTEPFYVENIKKHLDLNPMNRGEGIVPVKYTKTAHTVELVKRAELDVQKRLKSGQRIDCVWILFDKDSFGDFDDACKIIESKNKKEYLNKDQDFADENKITWHCCWSNEAFEVWVYLHFEDLNTPLPRDDYITRINKFIKDRKLNGIYKKSLENLYDFLANNGGDVNKAINLAEKKDPKTNCTKPNPSTGIYKLVKYFKNYFKK